MATESVFRETYRELTTDERAAIANIKQAAKDFLHTLDLAGDIGRSRELALAKTKLEEAVMWATKHVTR